MKSSPEDNPLRARMNQPAYEKRAVHVHLLVDGDQAQFTIRDDGPGFDASRVPQAVDAASFSEDRGRGLVLMKSFMDDVRFNAQGNEVTLVKRRKAARGNGAH
jgi:anti-sigma regulatory factor (Ser/Thr protein kinase)